MSRRLVRATRIERARRLPGDDLIPKPSDVLTHAITVNCSRRELWPWLVQMGADRAGWYSYDLLDNGGRHSAEEILRDFQNPQVGEVFPALPGCREGFVLIEQKPANWLILGWPAPTGGHMVTWAFVLDEVQESVTRLLVRVRASADYRFHRLPNAIGLGVARLVHFIMEQKQLVEIARRAERRKQTEEAMGTKRSVALGMSGAAAAAAVGAASYAAYVGTTWLCYGHPSVPSREQADVLLDRFMPQYEVAERHQIGVAAPRDVTFAALMDTSLQHSRVIRAIFKGREILLGAAAAGEPAERSLVALTKALGWRVLAEEPRREIVMGAVTQPWKPNVVFRGLAPDEFPSFSEPGYVKIIWTLRADADGPDKSVARTETRVIATDAEARRKFRSYWARFSPGIVLIRAISLRLVRKAAERQARLRAARYGGQAVQRGNGSSMEIVVPPPGGTSI